MNNDLISRGALLAEYDRVHVGPPGGARKLIENASAVDAVSIPCKIGDRVWAIRNYKGVKHPQEGIVNEMLFAPDMRLIVVVKCIARGEWGKTVFGTYEECQRAIEERNNK